MKNAVAVMLMSMSIIGSVQANGVTDYSTAQDNGVGTISHTRTRVDQNVKRIDVVVPPSKYNPYSVNIEPRQEEPIWGDTKWPTNAAVRNGHHYFSFKEKLSWEEAQKKCKSMGGHLAVFEDLSKARGGGFWSFKGDWVGYTEKFPDSNRSRTMAGSSSGMNSFSGPKRLSSIRTGGINEEDSNSHPFIMGNTIGWNKGKMVSRYLCEWDK